MKFLIYSAILITLVATPWVSADALIVPKIVLLGCVAGFILPKFTRNHRLLFTGLYIRLLMIFSVIFSLHMVVVMVVSKAPFEQEFFGQTGRGLGFVTYFSLVLLMLYAAIKINFQGIALIHFGLFISCTVSSFYALIQYFGFDIFDWRTQTNGIIGTIGNPNFQSSFIAMSLIPSIAYFWNKQRKMPSIFLVLILSLFTLYICNSTQGYIALIAASSYLFLTYFWYSNKKLIFFIGFTITTISSVIAILGTQNKGPLSYYLYKISVQSRGEMWRTTVPMIRDNPLTGVGLDSLGDYSLRYRDQKIANGIAEYIDNAHNFFLQFAATGGLPLVFLYSGILIISSLSIAKIQKKLGGFNLSFSALVSAWIAFQLQSLISPAAIPMLVWNFIFCGALVGINSNLIDNKDQESASSKSSRKTAKSDSSWIPSAIFATIAFLITFPLFNADRLAKQADSTKDGLLAVRAAKTYPESIVRYNRLGAGLYESGLYDLSLDVGRSAIAFNPNSYLSWVLVMVNPKASIEEREKAKSQLIEIDPFNIDVRNYPID